jgi:hypothetical protein
MISLLLTGLALYPRIEEGGGMLQREGDGLAQREHMFVSMCVFRYFFE